MSQQPPEGRLLDAVDEAILVELGVVARSGDPAPELVYELGRAAFSMRRIDAELAELVADTALDPQSLVGVRGADDTRLLSFAAGELSIEIEVREHGSARSLLGQVVAGDLVSEGSVRLETTGGTSTATDLDSVGGFRFDAVGAGPMRLHVERPDASPVATSWVNV